MRVGQAAPRLDYADRIGLVRDHVIGTQMSRICPMPPQSTPPSSVREPACFFLFLLLFFCNFAAGFHVMPTRIVRKPAADTFWQ